MSECVLVGWWISMSECALIWMMKFYVWMCAHLDGEILRLNVCSFDGEFLCLNVHSFGWWNSMSECVLIWMVNFYVWMCAHLDGEILLLNVCSFGWWNSMSECVLICMRCDLCPNWGLVFNSLRTDMSQRMWQELPRRTDGCHRRCDKQTLCVYLALARLFQIATPQGYTLLQLGNPVEYFSAGGRHSCGC